MRLLRFEDAGRAANGARIGDEVAPVAALGGFPEDTAESLAGRAARRAPLAAAAEASGTRARSPGCGC
jgi:hypothetical protein